MPGARVFLLRWIENEANMDLVEEMEWEIVATTLLAGLMGCLEREV